MAIHLSANNDTPLQSTEAIKGELNPENNMA